MKILHTADLHLKSPVDERWQALEEIIEKAAEEKVELVAISGDMFDKNINAENLKPALIEAFKKLDADIIILPGNHDAGSSAGKFYYGEHVRTLSSLGEYVDLGDTRIIGIPFENVGGREVMKRLMTAAELVDSKRGASNILLYHGELLDLFFSGDGYGSEGLHEYMPVRADYFDNLGFDYVLAGHFHSNFEIRRFETGYFIYPGSPVSITKKERGIRKVNIFDTGSAPKEFPLETFHYEDLEIELNPFENINPIAKIEQELVKLPASAAVHVVVRGFVDLRGTGMDNHAFTRRIDALKTSHMENITHDWLNIEAVLTNKLFIQFEKRLSGVEQDADIKAHMRRLAIRAVRKSLYAD